MKAHMDTFEEFYSWTFWCNSEVFQRCQAAQRLAKASENVVRACMGVTAGEAGQSLYRDHLNAVCGHHHGLFDPNVWYSDDELRKQVEQFVIGFIFTGQEAPETHKKLHELFKKTQSGDGTAGRKPYGMVSRMFELVGWTHLELNKMLRLAGVDERSFTKHPTQMLRNGSPRRVSWIAPSWKTITPTLTWTAYSPWRHLAQEIPREGSGMCCCDETTARI